VARLKSRALSNLDPTGVFRNLLGKEADFPARLSLLIKLTLEIRSQITGSTGIPFVSSQKELALGERKTRRWPVIEVRSWEQGYLMLRAISLKFSSTGKMSEVEILRQLIGGLLR